MGRCNRQSRAAARSVLAILFIMGFIAAVNNTVSAQQGTGPCKEEIAKFCKEVQPGRGRIAQCLKGHESELSPACKKRLARANEKNDKRQEFRQACKNDIEELCKGVKPGGTRILRCLKEQVNQLSPACEDRVAEMNTPTQ